jgi:stringent starvation protein B
MANADHPTSTKPYLIRALYEWCTDNGLTPYLAVHVGPGTRVPMEYVKNGEIVLNISFDATSGLHIGNDDIRFKARFGGVAKDIVVPISQVTAIYARETSQGMAFPLEDEDAPSDDDASFDAPPAHPAATAPKRLRPVESRDSQQGDAPPEEPPPPAPRPSGTRLTRVK